ncbi:hypothetical protein MBOU_58870 [Mycobacterium bourgelatii]|uniref:Uncharacterized protein n=1 Tax=Mycobacterium bourgelatii TaxID=1273442 RepID=A0A7I9YYY5_MYCBU|nr:hypothetical protein MBOU_58870 [Mycobacterium bourgelatii]
MPPSTAPDSQVSGQSGEGAPSPVIGPTETGVAPVSDMHAHVPNGLAGTAELTCKASSTQTYFTANVSRDKALT